MKDEIIKLFEKKYESGANDEQRELLKEIMSWRKEHEKKAKENQKDYFTKNNVLISLTSGNSIIKSIAALLGALVASIGIKEVFEWGLGLVNIIIGDVILTGMVLILAVILYGGFIYYAYTLSEKKKELKLKRYGETWVRHTVALYNYDQEIVKYLYALDYYNGETEIRQREIFVSNILTIEEKNICKFDENMKNMQEYIN